jgi:hypothetical protein
VIVLNELIDWDQPMDFEGDWLDIAAMDIVLNSSNPSRPLIVLL